MLKNSSLYFSDFWVLWDIHFANIYKKKSLNFSKITVTAIKDEISRVTAQSLILQMEKTKTEMIPSGLIAWQGDSMNWIREGQSMSAMDMKADHFQKKDTTKTV